MAVRDTSQAAGRAHCALQHAALSPTATSIASITFFIRQYEGLRFRLRMKARMASSLIKTLPDKCRCITCDEATEVARGVLKVSVQVPTRDIRGLVTCMARQARDAAASNVAQQP